MGIQPLAEYLKSTFDESLKKVVQPAGVIPGAIFVLLNLAFVYPEAKSRGVGAATQFAALEGAWQVVVIAVLIMIIGYLLLSASGTILDTLAGRTWSGSLWELASRERRNRRRDDLWTRVNDPDRPDELGTEREDIAAWRLHKRFAPKKKATATKLGDVLVAADASVEDRYGLRLAALWEPLRSVVDAEKPAATAVADQKSSLDLMANLTFVFGLFGLEAATLYSIWDRDGSVLLAAITLGLAYLCYRVTVTRVVSWTEAIDTVVMLYRDELLKEIGARKVLDDTDRKRVLGSLSSFALFNSAPEAVFESEVPGPELLCSGNVKAELDSFLIDLPADGQPSAEIRQSIKYVLVVTRTADGWSPVSAQVVLDDPRVPRIREAPPAAGTATAQIIEADGPKGVDGVLWSFAGIRRGEAQTLVFELDIWRFAVDQGLLLHPLPVKKDKQLDSYRVKVANTTDSEVTGATLEVFHAEDGPRRLSRSGRAIENHAGGPRGRRWTLRTIPAGDSIIVGFGLAKQEK